ncbi:hypothetical protein EYF80_048436 [Liparis tanakae]|uniref:Uncharacterized protein n=1 Tax=Liparis tanakae TaxID=230148 RepID=A0A4Z2FJT1_9TELE|nr:hypothetical protein EYF80_048436 [Liparis tanakae]
MLLASAHFHVGNSERESPGRARSERAGRSTLPGGVASEGFVDIAHNQRRNIKRSVFSGL